MFAIRSTNKGPNAIAPAGAPGKKELRGTAVPARRRERRPLTSLPQLLGPGRRTWGPSCSITRKLRTGVGGLSKGRVCSIWEMCARHPTVTSQAARGVSQDCAPLSQHTMHPIPAVRAAQPSQQHCSGTGTVSTHHTLCHFPTSHGSEHPWATCAPETPANNPAPEGLCSLSALQLCPLPCPRLSCTKSRLCWWDRGCSSCIYTGHRIRCTPGTCTVPIVLWDDAPSWGGRVPRHTCDEEAHQHDPGTPKVTREEDKVPEDLVGFAVVFIERPLKNVCRL